MPEIPRVTPSELALARLVVPARPRPRPTAASWTDRHPQAATLEAAAPGPELVAELALLVAADADDPALLEGIAAWERVTSWAAAAQATLLAELTRRATGRQVEFVGDEVAARLAVSGRSADALVERATTLDVVPELHDALGSGAVDVRKVDLLVRETRHLPGSEAREVVRAVLDDAPSQTAPVLRAAVRRAELAVDPTATERRHRTARRERSVRMTPAPSSMAWLTAYLPATDATTVMTALDAVAARQVPEDDRTADARRADALTDLTRQVLDSGVGPGGPLRTTQHRRPHVMVTVDAPALATALAGARRTTHAAPSRTTYCGALAELAGYGPIPVEQALRIAADADWRAVGVDPETGEVRGRSSRSYRPSTELRALVLDRDRTCTFPGCRVPAVRCDIDHVEPFDHARPAEGQTCEANLETKCRHHHRMKTHGGWTSSRDPATGVTTWVSPTGREYQRGPSVAAHHDAPPSRAVSRGELPRSTPSSSDATTPPRSSSPASPPGDPPF